MASGLQSVRSQLGNVLFEVCMEELEKRGFIADDDDDNSDQRYSYRKHCSVLAKM